MLERSTSKISYKIFPTYKNLEDEVRSALQSLEAGRLQELMGNSMKYGKKQSSF